MLFRIHGAWVAGTVRRQREFLFVKPVFKLTLATLVAASIAACAAAPPPPPDYPPPGARPLDAKTQLETGRRY